MEFHFLQHISTSPFVYTYNDTSRNVVYGIMTDNEIQFHHACVSIEGLFQTQQQQRIVLTGRKSLLCGGWSEVLQGASESAEHRRRKRSGFSTRPQVAGLPVCIILPFKTVHVDSQRQLNVNVVQRASSPPPHDLEIGLHLCKQRAHTQTHRE